MNAMIKDPLIKLKQATEKLASSRTAEEKLAALSQAFEMFLGETSKLEKSYAALKKKFESVNKELEQSNKKLKDKLLQLDIISRYLESILSNISQGLLFVNLSGEITTYNKAAEEILGYRPEQVLFHKFWENFDDKVFGFSMKESLLKPSMIRSKSTYQSGRTTKELEIEASFLKQEQEQEIGGVQIPNGMIVLVRDVTELRLLQNLANRNDRLKELGEMAARVAHEIRNPLGGIKGFASLLKRDLKAQPQLSQMAEYIVEGTDNLNQLVTNVLNYARPVQPHFEEVDLCKLMQELFDHTKADARLNEKISVSLDLPKETIIAQVDPQLIRGALFNLISNGIDAMLDGGKLTLGVKQNHESAVIFVEDTGIGIAPENLEKIFTPFFSTKPQGNGFGLAEVYKVVQAHGGTVDVISKENKGTVFSIRVPAKRVI